MSPFINNNKNNTKKQPKNLNNSKNIQTNNKMTENEFIDAETYYTTDKDPLNFKLIILTHLKKITTLSCHEWIKGHWDERYKIIGDGNYLTEKIYIESTTEQYINAILCLYDLLHTYFDKKMIKDDTPIQNKINNLKNDDTNEKIQIYRELFRNLSAFLKRIDYFNIPPLQE